MCIPPAALCSRVDTLHGGRCAILQRLTALTVGLEIATLKCNTGWRVSDSGRQRYVLTTTCKPLTPRVKML